MYQVLYRKYRPACFEDVSGQSHVTDTLRNELRLGRIHHAYLFTGSRGTGKTTCAKILAKAVNCLNPNDGDPCGVCENCRGIDSGEILDVVEMDAASNRGIDDIKNIIDEVAFAPARARYRVYIVDEVHMLTREAWNALLKTLEEPPAHVIFILATTEVNKIPETILSRCQRFDFHRISPADISARLKQIADLEHITLSDEAALLISVIADGALRNALSLLDRCIAISDDVTANVVRTAAGLAAQGHIFELADCTINKNVQKALELIDRLYRDSKDMISLCEELSAHFRALMLIKTVRKPRELVVMSDREFDAAVAESDYLTLSDIIYDMDVLTRARSRMKDSPSPRTELETAMVKLCAPELDNTDEALFARVEALEKAVRLLSSGAVQPASRPAAPVKKAETPASNPAEPIVEKPAVPEPKSAPPIPDPPATEKPTPVIVEHKEESKPTPPPAPQQPASQQAVKQQAAAQHVVSQQVVSQQVVRRPKVDMEELIRSAKPFALWPEVIANLKKYSRAIGYAFEDSAAYESGDYLLINTEYEIAFELLKKSDQRDQIRRAVQEVTGRVYKLGPYKLPEKQISKDDIFSGFVEKLRAQGVTVTETSDEE